MSDGEDRITYAVGTAQASGETAAITTAIPELVATIGHHDHLTPFTHSLGSMTPRLLTILKLPLFAWAMYMFIRT